MILAKIAWRNIWRNPRRSWVLVSAVAVGVFTFVGILAYIDGLSLQLVRTAIELQGGHIQISGAGYFENPAIRTQIIGPGEVAQVLDGVGEMRHAPQHRAQGMISSAEQSAGIAIVGVDPSREPEVSPIPALIVEGEWLRDDPAAGEIVIGAALAERLGALLGERVVLMASDLEGDMTAGAYRIKGLFSSTSADFDRANVFLHEEQVRTLIGFAPDVASTIAINLALGQDVTQVADAIRTALAGRNVEVLTWLDRSPMLVMMDEMMNLTNVILVVILFSAIGFTLINSFAMVIFERIREIGIMAAGGVRPGQVRLLLFLEAAFIVILGIGVGVGLATALIAWWSAVGLDLSAFAEGLSRFGAGAVIYPNVVPEHMLTGFVLIFVMVFLAVLYPAIKASRFKIVDAMNHA